MFFYQISFEGGYHVTMVFSNKDDIYIYIFKIKTKDDLEEVLNFRSTVVE